MTDLLSMRANKAKQSNCNHKKIYQCLFITKFNENVTSLNIRDGNRAHLEHISDYIESTLAIIMKDGIELPGNCTKRYMLLKFVVFL